MTASGQKLTGSYDMTTGSAFKSIVAFSVPLLIGNIFQQLYNTVDALVVGNAIGSNALAAVGASAQIIFFFISLFIGISAGAGVIISQAYGARDRERLQKAVSTMYGLTLYVGIGVSIVGFVLSEPILRLLRTPEEILDDSVAYLRIIFLGMLATAAYNSVGAVMRAVGDSFTPLIFLIISTVINIILDILLVSVFHLGIPSIAAGTVFAQAVAAFLSILRLNRMDDTLHLKKDRLKIYPDILPEILRIGLPSGIQQISISLGSMVIQGLVNSLGVIAVAGYTSFTRIDTFTTMPMMTISMAITTFVGQNIGARRMDRVSHGIKISILMVVVIAIVMSGTSLLFGRPLLSMFTPGETDVIDMGMNILWRVAPFYSLLGIMFCFGGVMRGAGEARVPMLSSILSVVIIRVPLAYLLYYIFQTNTSLWWAIPIAWVLGCGFQVWYYRYGNWRARSIGRMDSRLQQTAEKPEA